MISIPSQKPFRGMQLNRSHPLAKGLVGCWVMNEAAGGKIFDLSGNGNDGTIISSPKWGSDGLNFDGTDDFVDMGVVNQVDAAAAVTIIMSVKPTVNRDHWMFARSIGTTSTDVFILWVDDVCGAGDGAGNTDTFAFNVGSASEATNRVNGDTGLRTLNTWQTVAGVFNGTYRGLYHNGVLNAEHNSGVQTTIVSSANEFYIGQWEVFEINDLEGGIQYAYIYNRALSANEIAWLNREPYAMFQREISPGILYYEAAAGVSPTSVFYGPFIGPLGGPL